MPLIFQVPLRGVGRSPEINSPCADLRYAGENSVAMGPKFRHGEGTKDIGHEHVSMLVVSYKIPRSDQDTT